jgi:hypothetical protein
MINISPIFGQSRAKKKEIIADSKIAKEEFIKTDSLWKYFSKSVRLRYLPNVGRVDLSGGAAGNGAVHESSELVGKVIATEHRIPSRRTSV